LFAFTTMDSGLQTLKWGIVGCGRIARRFMQGLVAVPGNQLVSVWSRRRESVLIFTEKFGGHACGTFDDLLKSDIDVVYVATLPDSHPGYSIAALNAGKHVLCEKPAATNLAILNEIISVAKIKGLLFMEGMKPPFFPLYKKLKEYLVKDPIGTVGYVRAGSSVADISPDHPNFSYKLIGGSLMQIGIYEAFLAIDWLGAATEVQCLGRFGETGIDIFSIFQSEHESGYAQLYCGLDVHGKGDALICGTKGNVVIHQNWWNPAKATINYMDGRVVELEEAIVAGGLNYEIGHFCELIRNGKTESPVITHELSRQMITMLDKARAHIGLKFRNE